MSVAFSGLSCPPQDVTRVAEHVQWGVGGREGREGEGGREGGKGREGEGKEGGGRGEGGEGGGEGRKEGRGVCLLAVFPRLDVLITVISSNMFSNPTRAPSDLQFVVSVLQPAFFVRTATTAR